MTESVESFVQMMISGELERLSKHYWSTIETIDKERSKEFIELFKLYSKRIDERAERAIVGILYDLVYERGSDYLELYPVVLDMMYNNSNCRADMPYKYVLILLQLDRDREKLFGEIVSHTSVNSIESVCISIYTLYTSLGNLNQFESAKVRLFLDIVISCLQRAKSKKLAAVIEEILLPLIAKTDFITYYNRFALINREIG